MTKKKKNKDSNNQIGCSVDWTVLAYSVDLVNATKTHQNYHIKFSATIGPLTKSTIGYVIAKITIKNELPISEHTTNTIHVRIHFHFITKVVLVKNFLVFIN